MYQIWVRTKKGWQKLTKELMPRLQAHWITTELQKAYTQDVTFCEVGEKPCW